MTILMIDGFDMYDNVNSTPQQRGWAGNVSNAQQTGRFPNSRAVIINGASTALAWPMTAGANVSMGVAFKPQTINSGVGTGYKVLQFLNGATVQCQVGYDQNGSLVAGRGDFTTNMIGSATAVGTITINAWSYIEVELVRHASAGSLKVYVNGALLINATGVNTGSLDIDRVSLCAVNIDHFFDDFYVTNTASRLGERRVEYLPPSADTTTKDWTPSTGTVHFSMVNEFPTNGDSNYLSDATVGHKDLFDVTNLSSTPATIDVVQTVMVARKDDAATRGVRANVVSGATTTNGATKNMGSSYATFSDMYVLDPNTSAAWTASAVNALQLAIETVV